MAVLHRDYGDKCDGMQQGSGRARVGQVELPEGIGGLLGPGGELRRAGEVSNSPSPAGEGVPLGFPCAFHRNAAGTLRQGPAELRPGWVPRERGAKLYRSSQTACNTAVRSQHGILCFKDDARSKGMHIALLCAKGPGLRLHINLKNYCCRACDCTSDPASLIKGMVA